MSSLQNGEKYTLSFNWKAKVYGAKIANTSSDMYLRIYFYYRVEGASSDGSALKNLITFPKNKTTNMGEELSGHCKFTFTVSNSNLSYCYFLFQPNTGGSYHAVGDYMEMTNIMLEHAD